ncbi:hypothetical protein [Pedobacter sp. NJ-S-72]
MQQMPLDFDAPPRAAAPPPVAPPRPAAPLAPPRPPAAPRPAAPAARPSGGGGGSGRSVPMGGGGTGASIVGAVGRAVPFVAEAEVVLTGAAGASLMTATTAPLAAPLLAAAEALPVVAGWVAVIGAGTGHIVRAVANEAGASRSTADGLGLGAAVLTGAAIGSVIPGVGTAVGAGVGALVAGGLYLWSLLK